MRLISYAILAASTAAAAHGKDDDTRPPPIVAFTLTELDLFDRGTQSVVRVPITAADGVTVDRRLEVDVLAVAVGDTDAPELAHDIAAAAGADRTSIALTVALARFHAHEIYSVTIRVSEGRTAKPVSPVTQVLRLKHAAARARVVPDTLVIERTEYLPRIGAWHVPVLQLEELSGRSQLTPDPAVRDLHDAHTATATLAAPIRFAPPASVGPGSREAVSVTVRDHVPNDTVDGTAEIRAPQLEAPVTIKYELRTTLWSGWLALVMALGLLVGYAVKPRIYERLAVLRWRREVAEIAKAASAYIAHPDPAFAAACAGVVQRCRDAIAHPRRAATERDKQRDDLQKALDAAVTAWRDALAAATAATLDLERSVETRWSVPAELAPQLAQLRAIAGAAHAAIERGDATGARASLGAVDKVLIDAAPRIAALKTAVTDLAGRLTNEPGAQATPWPQAATHAAARIASDLTELATAIPDQPTPEPRALTAWLGALHALDGAFGLAAIRLDAAWTSVLAATRRELETVHPDPLDGADRDLPRPGSDPRAYLLDIAANGHATVAEVERRLLALAPKRRHKEVEELLRRGEWSHAAAAALAPRGEDHGQPAGAEPFGARAVEPTPAAPAASPPPPAHPVVVAPDVGVDTMLRRAVRAETLARETTSLVSAALVALLYFARYGTAPLHTWNDLLAVFAQAVSLDLGIDTVMQTLKGLAK
ncbi:MAG TPA: hypothetical protein VHT91_40030 [Kofleriaceae bacterium]|nr:hypothetical protein [Kofleriaceae bacterium]